jgi:signal transduction histidine kinase
VTQLHTTISESDQQAAMHVSPGVYVARVRWLVRLRWVYVVGLAILAAIAFGSQANASGPMERGARWVITGAAAFMVIYNLIVMLDLRLCARPGRADANQRIARIANAQITMDMIVMFLVMMFTGGVMTALTGVIVFHLAVAASLLKPRDAYVQSAIAGALYAIGLVAYLRATDFHGPDAWFAAVLPVFTLAAFVMTVSFVNAILARLRRLNRRLVESNRALAALDLTKSRFLRISSHQLRGPLAAITSLLSAMESAGPLSGKQADLIRRMRDRSRDVMAEIDEMMLLSTVKENAAETTRLAPVNLPKVITDTAACFRDEAAQRGLTITLNCGDAERVDAWDDALETVFEHLFSNALKYTPSGGRVTVSCRAIGAFAEVEVADTGVGIPEGQREQVFHEFFRGTNARQIAGGTGLGLAICKAIVERLGGTIALDSREGQGTTIRLRLPLSAAPAGDAMTKEAPVAQGVHTT